MTTNYTHPDYDDNKAQWKLVRDAVAGEAAIKKAGSLYLPDPDEIAEDRRAAAARYKGYLRRAVYLNATGRTLDGLLGVAFANWPTIETNKKVLLDDADGSGVGLVNQAQRVLADVLQTGRAGLLADYPRGDGLPNPKERTLASAEASGWRPYVVAYSAEQILTWETQAGRLTRVVLAETHEEYGNGEVERIPQLRELVLIDGGLVVQLWRQHSQEGDFIRVDAIKVGLPFVPFAFIGAINNDPAPDRAPLLDLATLNLHHYRNSADYEESLFLLGQPMLAISGVTDEWVEKTGTVVFGARRALALPEGGDAKLIAMPAGTANRDGMIAKEEQMRALGARLLEPGAASKTATQSAAETKAAYSVLSLACDCVSEGYTRALRWLETWGRGSSNASFAIDTHFSDLTLDANAIRETVAAWQAGLVPQADAVTVLQRLGVIDQGKTAEQVAGEVEAQGPALNLDEAA